MHDYLTINNQDPIKQAIIFKTQHNTNDILDGFRDSQGEFDIGLWLIPAFLVGWMKNARYLNTQTG